MDGKQTQKFIKEEFKMKETIKVYAKINENNIITDINSSIFLNNIEGYTQIDEGSGDKYAHAQGNYLEKSLVDESGRFNYKFEARNAEGFNRR